MEVVDRIASVLPVHIRQVGRLGRSVGSGESNSLPFIQAQAVRPGMVMFGEDGGYDIVESVEWVPLERLLSTTSTSSRPTISLPTDS